MAEEAASGGETEDDKEAALDAMRRSETFWASTSENVSVEEDEGGRSGDGEVLREYHRSCCAHLACQHPLAMSSSLRVFFVDKPGRLPVTRPAVAGGVPLVEAAILGERATAPIPPSKAVEAKYGRCGCHVVWWRSEFTKE